VLEKDFKI